MGEKPIFRRVLILADESADWIVAGLRQLERLALSVDEFALENKETAPVLVCIFWRPDFDQAQRWIPKNEQLTRVALTTQFDDAPYDLVLNTRLFLYRKTVRQLIEALPAPPAVAPSQPDRECWDSYFHQSDSLPRFTKGAWEFITDGSQIDEIEIRFLRESGKPQDGLVSRYLNRPLSRGVTRLLLRFPTTPNGWTLLIFVIPIIAAAVLLEGSYWSFVWGIFLFQVFSVLDGCDGELARAKFLESGYGRELDDLFDVLSSILLAIGVGFGLFRQATVAGHSGWFYAVEGVVTAALIGLNEFYLTSGKADVAETQSNALGDILYPRHRQLLGGSGLLIFGERFVFWLIQLTKRDVAILLFVLLTLIGESAWILHLLFVVTAISAALVWRARLPQQS